MPYKFVKELKKGDSGQEVTDLQNFIIEIHFEHVMTEDGMKTVVADGDFGDITANAIESIKAKALDYISVEYIKEKFKSTYNKDVPDEWLDINSGVNPLFGMLLEHFQEVQDYLQVTMKGMDMTPDPVPEPEPTPEVSVQDKLIDKIEEIEKGEVGVREDPPCVNTGERVNEYQDIGSNGELKNGGASWCNYFQNWGWVTACDALNINYKGNYSGYTPTTVEWGHAKGIAIKNPTKSQIKRGMWGFVHSTERGGGTSISSVHHIYYITGTKGNNVLTIEGNTGNGGSVNGDGVYARIRPINSTHCWCVVDFIKLYE
jgi:hypothetical protein